MRRRSFVRSLALGVVSVAWTLKTPVAANDDLPDGDKAQARRKEAIRRGLERLAIWQSEDGAWRSTTYGQLAQGPAGTALVLWASTAADPLVNEPWKSTADRGARWFAQGINRAGAPAAPDGTLDFPPYAAALMLIAAARVPRLTDDRTAARLRAYLLRAQCAAGRRFEPNHPDHGGWDLFGEETVGITSGTNISISRYVLQALRNVPGAEAKTARSQARRWLARGFDAVADAGPHGFPFTADSKSLNNKAQWTDAERSHPRAYGSSTCDGLLAMHCAGELDADDKRRVASAMTWLTQQTETQHVPGFADAPPELGWAEGLRYYYAATLAECLPLAPKDWADKQARSLSEWLVDEQREDGSWRSESSRMREDDPLVATAFALAALGAIEGRDAGEGVR